MSIDLRGIYKSFGGGNAVDGVTVSMPEGSMLVLLGPSGCGKTTTMRCIAGLETPDSGSIAINGRTVFDAAEGIDVPVNKRNVGMVFQSYAIWPHMTVYENVAFSLKMQGVAAAETRERVHDTLEQVGLKDYAERESSALSGGQMQRVALARSLVMRPSVLLFDEPLSNLDARLRDRLRVQLRELQTQLRITSVYVTHDQQEALALADQIVVMEHGQIRQMGDPVSIYNHPATSRVAEFLGYSNVFNVDETKAGDARTVELHGSRRLLRTTDPTPETKGNLAICVRPDNIGIAPLRDGSDQPLGENSFDGDITLASYMGSHMLYRARVAENEVWEVMSREISADMRLGSRVRLTVRPEDIRLVPV